MYMKKGHLSQATFFHFHSPQLKVLYKGLGYMS